MPLLFPVPEFDEHCVTDDARNMGDSKSGDPFVQSGYNTMNKIPINFVQKENSEIHFI